jgi:hypothetical protein
MNGKRISWRAAVVATAVLASCAWSASDVGLHSYAAVVDDVSGAVLTVGQMVVHLGFEVRLREVVANVPILSLQYIGEHYRAGPVNDPNPAEARAKSIAERMTHAWTLMDHGARLEVAEDNWNKFRSGAKSLAAPHAAIYVRSPVAGTEPLRILTVYPQDVAGYAWISNEKSLADYVANLIRAHYLLFWRNESDLSRYEELRLDRTREGRIIKEIAVAAVQAAKRKGVARFDSATLRDILAGLPLAQRERLYRLATTPPTDWEARP